MFSTYDDDDDHHHHHHYQSIRSAPTMNYASFIFLYFIEKYDFFKFKIDRHRPCTARYSQTVCNSEPL